MAEGLKGDALAQAMRDWRAQHPLERGTVRDVCDHVEHVARVAGIDHVGLGSDFDGIPITPVGVEDAAGYPAITAELLRRGWSERAIAGLLGGNVMRVLRAAERAAAGGG
jgi:membrane dipeptidase